MVAPKRISRKAFERFKGERWNTYNNLLALSDPADLTPIQRVAYLAYWYESEVINGGHFQYFHNQPQFNQLEVIEALHSLDAQDHAAVLTRAWSHFLKFEFDPPERVEEYVAMEADVDLSEFDKAFWSVGEDFIFHRLEEYLDKYEDEFLEWVP
jgi:hypothetical protein